MEDDGIFMDTWSILRSFVIFYGYLVLFVVIWYIFTVLVFCTIKNLAALQLCMSADAHLTFRKRNLPDKHY
jgi:hypothetical protein